MAVQPAGTASTEENSSKIAIDYAPVGISAEPRPVFGDVLTLDEAITLANKTEYGLTAGIFTEDEREVEEFFERIQAGVVYANRRAGATTGAWPGQNSFGGWKASGSTGKGTGGPHYVQQFFREQSRTRVR